MKHIDHKPPVVHLMATLETQARKRRQAASGFLIGTAIAAVGFAFFPAFLFPAGSVLGWFAKAFVDANNIVTRFPN